MASVEWLKGAMALHNAPKTSIISILKKNLSGLREERPHEIVHASDVTKPNFCPREWALLDLVPKKSTEKFLGCALAVTFEMGTAAETLFVEKWGGDAVVGNWQCRYCGDCQTMTTHPQGHCSNGRAHWWRYCQFVIETPGLGVDASSPDAAFNVGLPLLVMVEIKTLNPKDFEDIIVPQPEHRIRTNLYMRAMEQSDFKWKARFNTQEARVVYISRAHGKKNPDFNNEILPFKEFVVKRDDTGLEEYLRRAKALQVFRKEAKMPSGICHTALDLPAKSCSRRQECFSGEYPPVVSIQEQVV